MLNKIGEAGARLAPKLVVGAVAAILIMMVLFGSWYTIDQGERGVHLRNGAVVGSSVPGLGFKVPMIDSIRKVSIQNLTKQYDGVQAYSKDQQTAVIRVSVSFHVPPAEVIALYSEYGSIEGLTNRLVDRQVPTQVENVFGQYTAISAVQNRVLFVQDVTNAIRKAVHGPVVIDSVQIENIDFSDAYAIRSKAEALAQNDNLIELTKAERWNGVLPTTMIPNSTIPFLNANK